MHRDADIVCVLDNANVVDDASLNSLWLVSLEGAALCFNRLDMKEYHYFDDGCFSTVFDEDDNIVIVPRGGETSYTALHFHLRTIRFPVFDVINLQGEDAASRYMYFLEYFVEGGI